MLASFIMANNTSLNAALSPVSKSGINLEQEHIQSQENVLRVRENRVRRIFGPKRDETVGGRTKPHDEALHNLYSSPDIMENQGG
jgi:hypothetical protein